MKYFSIPLPPKVSAIYLRLYHLVTKVGIRSSMIDGFIGDEGLVVKVNESDKFKGYKFLDSDITIARLYEFNDGHRLLHKLKRLVRRNRGDQLMLTQVEIPKLKEYFQQCMNGGFDRYNAPLGALVIKDEGLNRYFDRANFYLHSLGTSYLMLNVIFHLNDETSKKLSDGRLASTTRRSIVINISSSKWMRKIRFHHSISSQMGQSDYWALYSRIATSIEDFARKNLSKAEAEVLGSITYYQTKKPAKEASKAIAHSADEPDAISNGYEKLLIGSYDSHEYISLYDKENIKKITPGTTAYVREFDDDFKSVFFYRLLQLHVERLKDKVARITRKRRFVTMLWMLFKDTANLADMRYKINNIYDMIDGYIWERFISNNISENGALKRFNYFLGGSYDLNDGLGKSLRMQLTTVMNQLKNASSKTRSELDIKNTRSNNRLTLIIAAATIIALAIAIATLAATLYPSTAKKDIIHTRNATQRIIKDVTS